MKKLLLLSLVIATATTSASANAYRMETGALFADSDKNQAMAAFFDYHFDTVDTSKGPLNEANFLGKSSHLGFSYANSDFVDVTASKQRFVNPVGVEGRYVFDSDWTLAAGLSESDSDFGDGGAAYGVTVGKYLTEHSELYVGFADSGIEDADSAVKLGYKSVVNNFGYDTAVTTIDGEYAFSFDGMYYFTRSFGLGAGLVYDSVSEDTNFNVAASYFFTDGVAVEFGYEDASEAVVAAVNIRF